MKLKKLYLLAGCLLLTGCGASETDSVPTENVEDIESTETETVNSTDIIAEYDFHEYVTLGDYQGLSVTVESADISDQDVDYALEQTRQSHAEYKELDVTTPREDDWVDLKLTFSDDYVWQEYVQAEDEDLPETIKECIKSLVVGTETTVLLEDASYFGAYEENAECSVEIVGIYELVTPEATDEWISSISDYATLDEWKEATKANLIASVEEECEKTYKNNLYDLVMDNAKFEVLPQGLVDTMYNQYYDEDVAAAEDMGMTLEVFTQQYYGFENLDDYELSLQQFTEECIKDEFLTTALADELNISYTDEEYDAFVTECLEYYGYETVDELEENYGKTTIEQACLSKVVWDAVADLNIMIKK